MPLRQSLSSLHELPSAQLSQSPPQSTSVSVTSWKRLEQDTQTLAAGSAPLHMPESQSDPTRHDCDVRPRLSSCAVHDFPSMTHSTPPQSTSVSSSPSCPSLHVVDGKGAAHVPSAQLPLEQSRASLHPWPSAHVCAHDPPQFKPVSSPSRKLLKQSTQALSRQLPLAQSPCTMQNEPSSQVLQRLPPQSTSVSNPSLTPFWQEKQPDGPQKPVFAQSSSALQPQSSALTSHVSHSLPTERHSTPPPSLHVSYCPIAPEKVILFG